MQLNNTPIFIGTSGYNHEDWKGTFAPQEIFNYDLLTYYADKGFNFLELAFTFYRMPERDKIAHILLRTGDRVRFSVRLPKALIKEPDNDAIFAEFMKGIAPMIENGVLACVYADFHASFSVSKQNQEKILTLKKRFDVPFFAELPNRTWYKGRIFEYFKEHSIGMTIIDAPVIKGYAPYYPICTNNNLYFKLYGRAGGWLTAGNKILNYVYTKDELNKFVADAVDNSVLAQSVFFAFANVGDGKAPENALQLMEIVDII